MALSVFLPAAAAGLAWASGAGESCCAVTPGCGDAGATAGAVSVVFAAGTAAWGLGADVATASRASGGLAWASCGLGSEGGASDLGRAAAAPWGAGWVRSAGVAIFFRTTWG